MSLAFLSSHSEPVCEEILLSCSKGAMKLKFHFPSPHSSISILLQIQHLACSSLRALPPLSPRRQRALESLLAGLPVLKFFFRSSVELKKRSTIDLSFWWIKLLFARNNRLVTIVRPLVFIAPSSINFQLFVRSFVTHERVKYYN